MSKIYTFEEIEQIIKDNIKHYVFVGIVDSIDENNEVVTSTIIGYSNNTAIARGLAASALDYCTKKDNDGWDE